MSGYEVAFYPDALKDVKRLDGSQRKNVLKAIEKIRANPLSQNEGGFGGSAQRCGVRGGACPASALS